MHIAVILFFDFIQDIETQLYTYDAYIDINFMKLFKLGRQQNF